MKRMFYALSGKSHWLLCLLLSVLCCPSNSLFAQITISTVAGSTSGYAGDGGPATMARLNNPKDVTTDGNGNIYIADTYNNVIRKVDPSGVITTIAGVGGPGLAGDGGPATAAAFFYPSSIAIDTYGNIYIADQANCRIRKIDTLGIVSTFAGSTCGYSGDGGPATAAQLNNPYEVAIGSGGKVYFTDYTNNCVRMVDPSGVISTVAGTGIAGFSGDGGLATAAQFDRPYGIAFDAMGNMYVGELGNHRIRKVNTAGIVSTIAGTGVLGTTGDGGPATAARLGSILGMTIDAAGNIFVCDLLSERVRKIDISGVITAVAGNGSATYSGDGGAPLLAGMIPNGVAIVNDSSFYIADLNDRIRFVGPSPCSGVPTAGTLVATTTSGCGPYTSNLSLVGTTGASRITYKWQSSTDNLSWVSVLSTINSTYAPNITSSIYYRCVVVCNASGLSDTTNSLFFDNPVPVLSPITGVSSVCPSATTTYTDTASGGVWSSSNLSVAAADPATGVVISVAAGTATISYTKTNGCGTTTVVQVITVNPSPSAGTITGSSTVCATVTTALGISGGDAGGAWSSSTPATAAVSGSGVVTGIAGGTTTISYSVINTCGAATATKVVTVTPQPNSGTITGTTAVCSSATTTLTSTGDAGGVWSSSSAMNATVGVTGVVTGITAGTATITYTVSNSCGVAASTTVVTVNPLPNSGTITGIFTVCPTTTTTLSSLGDAGGNWTSSSIANAIVTTTTGIVTGVTAGTSTISYTVTNGCGTANATKVITVNPLPDAGTITGATSVCATSTISLTDAATGGVWTSSTPAKATINVSGVVTGVAIGTTTISYSVTNSCGTAAATKVVTVNPLPNAGTITGTAAVCPTATTTLSSAGDAGGAWTSGSANATVGAATGIVTGVAAGTATISYRVTNGCGIATATRTVTINASPNAGTIVGSSTCPSSSITLTNPTGDAGGTWTSGTPAVATINSSTGLASGVSFGTTLISYSVTNVCGTAATSIVFTVNASPNAGTITGASTVCPAATITLSNGVSGGGWTSSTPARATVNTSGVVTGVSAGTTTISYSVTNVCGTEVATKIVTVNASPNAGTITGVASTCLGYTTTLSDAITGGVWSSSTPGVATVDVFGVVTSVTSGTSVISYSVTNICGTAVATRIVTVNALPSAIIGAGNVCQGTTATLSNSDIGGTWSASNASVSIIPSSGVATGITNGTVTITYTLPTGCFTTIPFTVNALPSPYTVTGGGSYCPGGTGVNIGLSGSDLGITYQLYSAGSTIGSPLVGTGTVLNFGLVTPAGIYTVEATNSSTFCSATMMGSAVVSISSFVVPSVGISTSYTGGITCSGATATFTANPVNGGTTPAYQWSVNGSVVGASPSYSYTPASGDIVSVILFPAGGVCVLPATATGTQTVTVAAVGTPSVTIGSLPSGTVCPGVAVTFSATATMFAGTAPSFVWIKNGVYAGTSPSYAYIPANGDIVSCKMVSNYACRLVDTGVSNTVTASVGAIPAPAVVITGVPGTTVAPGQTLTLTANASGGTLTKLYQWFVNGVLVPGATNNTYASSTFIDGSLVSCRVANTDACGNYTEKSMTVYVRKLSVYGLGNQPSEAIVYPNPNDGAFVLNIPSNTGEEVNVVVSNVLGVKVRELTVATNKDIDMKIDVPGIYIVTIHSKQGIQSLKVNVR